MCTYIYIIINNNVIQDVNVSGPFYTSYNVFLCTVVMGNTDLCPPYKASTNAKLKKNVQDIGHSIVALFINHFSLSKKEVKGTRQIIRYRATVTLRRPQIKQYTAPK